MIAMVIVSLVAIGITTVYFFKLQNDKYHFKRIQRKQKTVNLSLEYFLNELSPDEVDDFVSRDFDLKVHEIAKVNSLIIHVFNTKGEELINTEPRDSIFKNSRLNPFLLYKLESAEDGKYVEKKENGSINSYSFAKNKKGENMVVINIPYNPLNFTAKTEVNLFLERLIEVFLVLFTGALLIAYLLTRYITKSIEEVRKKIEVVEINETNEKLIWEKQDEIGVLVNAYNKMIDKLEISKKKLAQNERQTAWREMAKQIAHEIKNPLTPMKLSVQHLRRVVSLKGTDEKHLKQFEDKMIGQIELLTEIADEFSNFAELPKAKMKSIDLSAIIRNTISLYNHHKNIRIAYDKLNEIVVFGDENQLTRVFNNLLKNSIQAVDSNGEISISTEVNNIQNVILIEDNGVGIPAEIEDKIFEPKFTTKSSGKGLGLPIVAQIIRSHGGEISLMKKNKKGTCFRITLPILKDESEN